jgi:hypothetical protein
MWTGLKLLAAAVLAAGILVSAGVSARELTEAEKGALAEEVSEFSVAIRAKDTEKILSVVPPAVFAHLAEQHGLEVDVLLASVAAQTEEVMAGVEFDSFSMDTRAASYREAADGTPYALIPTEMVMSFEGGRKVKAASDTFAMLDEGQWYLIRTDEPVTLAVVKSLYPTYVDVEFPAGTMEAVND